MVDGHLIIGNERFDRLISVDPVLTVVYEALDGATELDELATDLASLDGISQERARWIVTTFVAGLAADGFLEDVDGPIRTLPRRVYTPLDDDSCLAARLGLGRSQSIQVLGEGAPFRIASTYAPVIDELAAVLTTTPLDKAASLETLVLRATGTERSRRLQGVYDSLGRLLCASSSRARATEAFRRTVNGRVQLSRGGAWIEGPVLCRGERAALIPSGFAEAAFRTSRLAMDRRRIECIPSGLNELLQGGQLRCPADATRGIGEIHYEVVFAMIGGDDVPPAAEVARELLRLCRYWDQSHFDAVGDLLGGHFPLFPWCAREDAEPVLDLIDRTL